MNCTDSGKKIVFCVKGSAYNNSKAERMFEPGKQHAWPVLEEDLNDWLERYTQGVLSISYDESFESKYTVTAYNWPDVDSWVCGLSNDEPTPENLTHEKCCYPGMYGEPYLPYQVVIEERK